jgi:predicted AlkP superfamily pyrophosphatase or phosphodiesterase
VPNVIIRRMINSLSLSAVEKSGITKEFIKPLYDSYCFSNIPQTIKNVLLGEKKKALPVDILSGIEKDYKKIVLFLIDGFGWSFFERHSKKYPFLQQILDKGVVSKLTSQYPSTTAPEVTTIHTGQNVGKSGVYEWFYYEPQLDTVIAPLLFSHAGEKERDSLISTGIDPKMLYPSQTIYKDLGGGGVSSYVFQYQEYANTPYSIVATQGSTVIPYSSFTEALSELEKRLLTNKTKSYYFVYFDGIDKAAHNFGNDSKEADQMVDTFFKHMEEYFLNKLSGKINNTLFMLTADHGHASINPKATIYLNNSFPQIKKWIKKNRKGELIVPAGSCRNMILHIENEYIDEAQKFLRDALAGKAEVYKTSYLIKEGFFAEPSEILLSRIGDLTILPYKNESVWWYEKNKFEIKYLSHHGGMTRDEMEIPLLCLPL